MKQYIKPFIDSKDLSINSQKSYYYDLNQFIEVIHNRLTKERLAIYEQSIKDLTISAKKRKQSAVNQFLLFLYEHNITETFFKLKSKEKLTKSPIKNELINDQLFFKNVKEQKGQLIALLILEVGLLPNEIQLLKWADIDLDYHIISLKNENQMRIIDFSQSLVSYMTDVLNRETIYLFEKNHHYFSRQWHYNRLKSFLNEIGLPYLNAQLLREQYILRQIDKGKTIEEVRESLGLKSQVTLEKYFKH